MPGGDRTGPMGMGPRTGRVAGLCAGNGMPGFANFGDRRGFGRRGGMASGIGSGGGYTRGWRHRVFAWGITGRGGARGGRLATGYSYPNEYSANPHYENTRVSLDEEVEYLKSTRDDINRRLETIEAEMKSDRKS